MTPSEIDLEIQDEPSLPGQTLPPSSSAPAEKPAGAATCAGAGADTTPESQKVTVKPSDALDIDLQNLQAYVSLITFQ